MDHTSTGAELQIALTFSAFPTATLLSCRDYMQLKPYHTRTFRLASLLTTPQPLSSPPSAFRLPRCLCTGGYTQPNRTIFALSDLQACQPPSTLIIPLSPSPPSRAPQTQRAQHIGAAHHPGKLCRGHIGPFYPIPQSTPRYWPP